ncbi:DUF4270 domain-containing protein [Aquimarina muelleri]|uniref:DUF4270 domain-containing protein n=1 Tax=Aquimarina muelleri TaxID=279356 RepID=UPI003F6826F5
MKLINIFTKITTIVVVISTFLSCDNDFNSVGSEIIGDVNFEDSQYSSIPVAYSRRLERVQTSRLVREIGSNNQLVNHANLLGVYEDPAYGQSIYSILSQVRLATDNPNFGENPVLDSVVLNLPYFSKEINTSTSNNVTIKTYKLDSVYGSRPFKLSIYQSNYFLRDFDPETNDRQLYYSDDAVTKFGSEVEKLNLYTNESFVPSPSEITLLGPDGPDEDTNQDVTKSPPALRIKFSDAVKNSFKEQFLDKQGSSELSNSNNFFNYFRGIYFKAEASGALGNMVLFDMSKGRITLHYTSGAGTPVVREQKTLQLSFTNNIVNSIKTDIKPSIENELKIDVQDSIKGNDNLYIKGGDGAYAVIDLFKGNVLNENGELEKELSYLRRKNWLINDAVLTFYVNQSALTSGGATEPERIYVFNKETGSVLADYASDVGFQLKNEEEPVNSILSHLGRIKRGSDDKGEYYKIRLTRHIIDLLGDEEVDNISLGVSVSQNVNATINAVGVVKNKNNTPKDEIIPSSSIISHEGTILYGNGENVPEEKRLKLDIFYTASKKN